MKAMYNQQKIWEHSIKLRKPMVCYTKTTIFLYFKTQ